MKKVTVLYIICLLPLLSAYGQSEEVTIESSEENVEEGNFKKVLEAYNTVIRAEEEKLTLFKIDLLSPVLYVLSSGIDENEGTIINNVLRVGFEKKYKPDWSWFTRAKLRAENRDIDRFTISGGIRYYYNLNRRILKGKSANNFSANYLALEPAVKFLDDFQDSRFTIRTVYGIQRRLWKRGYLDFDIGLESVFNRRGRTSAGLEFTSSLEIGIAF